MLLIVTNSKDVTSDFLEERIKNEHFPCIRLNTDTFPLTPSLSLEWLRGKSNYFLSEDSRVINIQDISSVWWRRPQDYGKGVEKHIRDKNAQEFAIKQITDAVEIIQGILTQNENILWVNHPFSNKSANSKFVQMQAAHLIGFKVPDTVLSNDPREVRKFYRRHGGRVIFKATRRPAFFDGEEMVGFYTACVNESHLEDDEAIRVTPILLQERIQKKFELRITVIGNQVFAARIDSQEHKTGLLDWRLIPNEPNLWKSYKLDPALEERCRVLTNELNLNFGAIDLAVTPDDEVVFFEINPNGQWAWLEIEARIPLSRAFLDLFFLSQK